MAQAPIKMRSRISPTAHGRRIVLTSRDIAMFRLLDRYRYLPSHVLLAFVGGNAGYHKARMTDLFHEGWLDKPQAQWEMLNARYRHDSYMLGRKAKLALDELGGRETLTLGAGGPFRHERLLCLVMAHFELSARRHDIALHGWKDILLAAPVTTRDAPSPFSIPTTLDHDGARLVRTLRPDGWPFTLVGARSFSFIGVEIDRHTEPLHPADLRARNSSILLKFLQYRHVVRERVFESRFGLPNVLVPIITINRTHMDNMVRLMMDLTDGQGAKWMLFHSIDDLAGPGDENDAQSDLLRIAWQRPGNPPLCMLDELLRT